MVCRGVKPPKNASEQEKKIAEEFMNGWMTLKILKCFCLKPWMPWDMATVLRKSNGINLAVFGCLKFQHAQPRLIMTPYNQPNELRLNDGSPDGAEFWPFGWFIHRHKAKSGLCFSFRIVPCFRPFLFKNYGVRDIMEFLETYGLPSKLVNIPLVQLMLKK
jgi:phage gp29-like protein